MNRLLLRRTLSLAVPAGTAHASLTLLAALQKNLEALGYALSPALFARLATLSSDSIGAIYLELIDELRRLRGAHYVYKPLYPNFPAQVMALDEARLYCNAILHYAGLASQFGIRTPRPPSEERPHLKPIALAEPGAFETLVARLLRARTPYSPQDREDVALLFAQAPALAVASLPEEIPNKENLAVVCAQLLRNGLEDTPQLERYPRTATDVLRIAVGLCDGDVSLAAATKFGRFPRRWRARLLAWMERAPNVLEDMQRWKGRWQRLGERLHPGEYAARFPQTAAAFQALRNGQRLRGFNAQVETALAEGRTGAAVDILQQRPGELARRLDHLARLGSDAVADAFARHADAVSTAVLLQVLTHFRLRQSPPPLRIFFPKGQVGNLFALRTPAAPIAADTTQALAAISEQALLKRFAALPPLGACYLDPQLADFLVPFSQRSASKSLRTLVRGSRVPLPPCTTLRFFLWWRNARGRVDIDLSAAMYADDYAYVDTLAYYNLRNFGAHHSGDIVDAPEGAAEFIDIELDRCRRAGVRYVVMAVNNFTEQAFCELPECFAGWMARTAPGSGEIFEAATVENRFDLASDTRFCLPIVFDIQAGEALWCDIALSKAPYYVNNVHNNLAGVSLMLRAMTQLRKTDLHTLFDLHIRARGHAVDRPSLADTVFCTAMGIQPTDLERISAEFL